MNQVRAGKNRGETFTLTYEVTRLLVPSVTPRRSRFGPYSQSGVNTPVISRPLTQHEDPYTTPRPNVPSVTAWRTAAFAHSQVPGRPLRTCPALRPRRTAVPGHYRTGDVVFRTLNNVDSAFAPFEAQSRGLHALCVRFAAGVAPGPRNTRFRLVANLDRSGLSPAGSHRWFTVMSVRLHGVLHHQASPGAIKDGLG